MKAPILLATLALLGAGCLTATAQVTTFEECAAAGNPVMESYPRQCRAGGKTFVEVVAVPPTPPGQEPAPAPQPNPEPTPPADDPSAEDGQPVTLSVGASATFSGGLRVTLVRVDDSRCPKDVVCVWAGELSPVLSVQAERGAAVEVTLGTATRKLARVASRTIELKEATETTATIVVTE